MNIQTDGTISPEGAVKEASNILIDHFTIISKAKNPNINKTENKENQEESSKESDKNMSKIKDDDMPDAVKIEKLGNAIKPLGEGIKGFSGVDMDAIVDQLFTDGTDMPTSGWSEGWERPNMESMRIAST